MPSSPPLTPLAAAVLHVGSPERVLQIECGEGEGALFLAREFPSARVRGIDRSAEAVRHAQGRAGLDPEGRIAFKQGVARVGSLSLPTTSTCWSPSTPARTPGRAPACSVREGFWSSPRRAASGSRRGSGRRLLRRRLARAGFEPIWEEPAGDGSFSVSRLRGGGPIGGSL